MFKKRKYGNYPGFELSDTVSKSAINRLQAAIGSGIYQHASKELETPQEPAEVPAETPAEPAGEEQESQE